MTDLTPELLISLHNEALVKAREASNKYLAESLNGQDQMPCGFAWISLSKVRQNSKIGKLLPGLGYRFSSYDKAFVLWDPAKYPGQNVDAKYVGAKAYADVFRNAGVDNLYALSRWD